jgi:hypothetical protein
MSIAKAQAQALAEGFLDNIGEAKDLQPRETFSEIILLAGEMVEDMQANLNKSNSNATDKLSKSIAAAEPYVNSSTFKVDIFMLYYGQFLNKGVKGTKGGSGMYAFKHDFPSKAMIESLSEWVKQGKAKIVNTNVRKSPIAQEQKNGAISELSNLFALARSIKQKGIKAVPFVDEAAETTRNKVSDRLGKALKIDVLNSLKNNLQ